MKRILKVYSQSSNDYTPVPTIILKGKWLNKAGFKEGDYIELTAENGEMRIVKTEKPKKALSLEEKIEGLDDKQRKEIEEMVDKII